jgi:hypothetical protein
MFSKVVAPICIPTQGIRISISAYFCQQLALSNLWILAFKYGVESHGYFHLHFPYNKWW